MALKLELPYWYDLHAHFRQGDLLAPLLAAHAKMGCAGVLAMPNTSPPVAKIHAADALPYESLESYHASLVAASAGAFDDIIVPLYLTADTTPAMIERGAKSGLLRACKYYPPHGTTGADHGAPLDHFMDSGVFRAMEEAGIVLCLHGEEHHLQGVQYFDRNINAEKIFYTRRMPELRDRFPALRMVCEHLTSADGVAFVRESDPARVAATVTPQHLLYTVGDLLKGLKYHLYCLPLLKFDEDRAALRQAVTGPANTQFFAGTDSAPHADKVTACGCAAGCFTGAIAPQLYAQAFEEAGADLKTPEGALALRRFLCDLGPAFYGLRPPARNFVLERKPQTVEALEVSGRRILPLPLGLAADQSRGAVIPWSISRL